jgi:hypothetical protein
MPPPWHFTTWLDLLYHWQSLAAGLVALAAAIIAVGGSELFGRLKERRERKAILLSLAAEVSSYLDLFIRKREMIQRLSPLDVRGRDLKVAVELPSPTVFLASADRIGLLRPRIAAGLIEFYGTYEGLNLAVRIATTDPGRRVELDQFEELGALFERACRSALPLLAKLPHEKADAALKKTIESFPPEAEARLRSASPPRP